MDGTDARRPLHLALFTRSDCDFNDGGPARTQLRRRRQRLTQEALNGCNDAGKAQYSIHEETSVAEGVNSSASVPESKSLDTTYSLSFSVPCPEYGLLPRALRVSPDTTLKCETDAAVRTHRRSVISANGAAAHHGHQACPGQGLCCWALGCDRSILRVAGIWRFGVAISCTRHDTSDAETVSR